MEGFCTLEYVWGTEFFIIFKKYKKLWKGSEKSFQQDAQGPKSIIYDSWQWQVFFLVCASCIVIIAPLSYNIVALPIDSFEWHQFFCCKILLNNPFGRQKDRRGWGSSCKRRSNVFTLKFSHMQLPKYFHLLLKDYIESWILNQIKEALTDSICGSIRPADISSSSSR